MNGYGPWKEDFAFMPVRTEDLGIIFWKTHWSREFRGPLPGLILYVQRRAIRPPGVPK